MTTMLDELQWELDSEVRGQDTRVRIQKTDIAPHRLICQLEVDGEWWGSGTLIGPRTVLTAGHCLTDHSDVQLVKSRMRILQGRNGDQSLGTSKVSDFVPMDGYDDVSPTDVGIIQLTARLGDKFGWWTTAHSKPKDDAYGTSILNGPLPMPAGNLKVNLCGYPGDKPPGATAKTRGTVQYLAYDETVKRKNGMLYYENDTYHGHSGSPVWVRRHASMGGRVLCGIHVGADGGYNAAVFIDAKVRKFITDNILK